VSDGSYIQGRAGSMVRQLRRRHAAKRSEEFGLLSLSCMGLDVKCQEKECDIVRMQ
jgi:hypothetical protein